MKSTGERKNIVKKLDLGKIGLEASRISLGCMRMSALSEKEAEAMIKTAMEQGINFFDHADIYGGGESERIFAKAVGMCPSVRETMLIQSKCGIRPGMFDFSKEHILEAVDGSLKRLKTEYLDVLLLHRPDTLMEPEEVAEAFSILKSAGKVRYFGVSNQHPLQMELLQIFLPDKLIVNQLQLSIAFSGMIDFGFHVNMKDTPSVNHDNGILEYCRLHDITIQAWSPFQYGFFEGVFLDNDKYPELNAVLDQLAEKYGVSKTALAVAWISRHPAKIQTIVGTMKPKRLVEICDSEKITLSREDWYAIYRAAGNVLP